LLDRIIQASHGGLEEQDASIDYSIGRDAPDGGDEDKDKDLFFEGDFIELLLQDNMPKRTTKR